jgi:lipoate-protein ligase B
MYSWAAPSTADNMIIDLELVDYLKAYNIQKELVARRRMGEIDNSVILAEHHPVLTIGRSSKDNHILAKPEDLARMGIEVLKVDRGGDITFHGPGQLIVYPILDLAEMDKDLHFYMRSLEDLCIDFLDEYAVDAGRIDGKTGVWVDGRKIASIGIAATNWITYHGISINLNTDLRFFSLINPCGMRNIKMTSLNKLLARPIDMEYAKALILEHFDFIFGPVTSDRDIFEICLPLTS